jgi:UDP-N-acetylglucosamine diphosphorylase / glucose-1-phosphate thymidylyltransferase / UDP-N-acetylgalactosamine diphosphorylase / glucosamine-1-phosphate N-acetyltransferase / galactosamine-1-phosphate N-acetyltransferase
MNRVKSFFCFEAKTRAVVEMKPFFHFIEKILCKFLKSKNVKLPGKFSQLEFTYMQLCIFEDQYFERLEPLIYTRPVYQLVCGINSLRNKIIRAYEGVPYTFHCRSYLQPFLNFKYPNYSFHQIEDKRCLFINGRILAPSNLSEIIPFNNEEDKLYVNGETIIAARVSGKKLTEMKNNLHDVLTESDFDGLPVENVEINSINYIWDVINNNAGQMRDDFSALMKIKLKDNKERIRGKVFPGSHLIEEDNIFIDEGAEIRPGAVIDATNGPIYIDKNSIVFPNAVVEGAVYLGEGAHIKSCSRIYENVSIGKVAKVGGEVEDSIVMPYTNKQHSGFLGHAYLGSWVNIGADTNCSDLKNNYGSVKIYVNGEVVDSGSQFLGVIIGDHSKTAINTMFNTGTIVGFSSNIFGAGFPDKYLPSFSWGGSDAVTTYDIEKSIETAKRMLQRRLRNLSDVEEKLFRKIFDLTKKERRKRGYPY